jgi:ElaB/YqjD/DUF883 family membrane-anchored ribosome-binding protein
MSMTSGNGRLSELERQVDDQRRRVEQRIHDIQDQLSPGHLLDQALRYTRHGGAGFANSLGNAVAANPVPAVLLGISLAWLAAGPKHPSPRQLQRPHLPHARVSNAGLQRTRHEMNEAGEWFSHFVDDAGTEYRARADETGKRLGHFMDSAGRGFGGFVDEAGRRVETFRDEAGNLLEDVANWSSHTFDDIGEALGGAMENVAGEASRMGDDLQRRAGEMKHSIAGLIHEQPLVAGALAFAAGAALGTALPPTAEEDEAFGREADKVKRGAEKAATGLYREGKKRAEDLYEDAADAVRSAHDAGKSAAERSGERPPRPN